MLIQIARGNSGCSWLFGSGGNPLSPLPRTPLHKRKEQSHVAAGGQSQRAQTLTDKQTDTHTKLLPQDVFSFYDMETSSVAARPRTVNSRLVN